MVLHHIPDRSHIVVKASSILHAELLRHRDLNAFHVEVVPDRLEEGVGEAKVNHILDGILAQIMIDAEDIFFRKDFVNYFVKSLRRGQVSAERLLHDDARALR